MAELNQLIYSSNTNLNISEDELKKILDKSRSNNIEANITGMLLYRNGSFVQVLEGPRNQVKSTYDKIAKDLRHKDVTVLFEAKITDRDFPNWAMAFNGFKSDPEEGMSDFLHPLRSKDQASISSGAAKQLLIRFREIHKR